MKRMVLVWAMMAGLVVGSSAARGQQTAMMLLDFQITEVRATDTFRALAPGGVEIVVRLESRFSTKKLPAMRAQMIGKTGRIEVPVNVGRFVKAGHVFLVPDFTINGVSVVGVYR